MAPGYEALSRMEEALLGIPGFANASINDKPLMTLGWGSQVLAVAFSSDDRSFKSVPEKYIR